MTETMESELLAPDGYLQPRKYRVTYRCEKCGHQYKRDYKAIPIKDPPCPNKECAKADEIADLKRQVANLTIMLQEQRAPGVVGSQVVKAVDKTADIVMSDYKMTNLQDNVREGDTVAAKLPPAMQQAADSYFGGGIAKARGYNPGQIAALNSQAINGAFRGMAVSPKDIGFQPLRKVN